MIQIHIEACGATPNDPEVQRGELVRYRNMTDETVRVFFLERLYDQGREIPVLPNSHVEVRVDPGAREGGYDYWIFGDQCGDKMIDRTDPTSPLTPRMRVRA